MKRYTEAEKDRVRANNPISKVIEPYVTWDRARTNPGAGDFWACCPFHAESTPSFHCEDLKHRYKCFGCGASGDQFTFLQEHQGMSFLEAMEHLGGQAEPEPLSPEQIAADKAAADRKRREQEAFAEKPVQKCPTFLGGPKSGTFRAKKVNKVNDGKEYWRPRPESHPRLVMSYLLMRTGHERISVLFRDSFVRTCPQVPNFHGLFSLDEAVCGL